MLKELTQADWMRILNIPASRIPAVLILRGTRNFRSKYEAMLPHFDNVLEIGTPNGIIEDVLIGDVRGRPVGFACVYGSSMASELVHVFGVLGTRTVLQIGNCGALADDLPAPKTGPSRSRRRRRRKKKGAAAGSAPEAQVAEAPATPAEGESGSEETAAPAEVVEAAAPRPKRRRRRRPAAEGDGEALSEAPTETDAAA